MDPDRLPKADDWIIVPRWDEFQHYRDRNPLWIKVYAKLLHDPGYIGLSLAAKGLLQVVWLLYSQTNGQCRIDDVRKTAGAGCGYPQWISLYQAGFVEFAASKPLAAKKEKEKEKETPISPLKKASEWKADSEDASKLLLHRALEVATDWTGGPSYLFDEQLDELERELQARLSVSQRSKLWDEALKREQSGRTM